MIDNCGPFGDALLELPGGGRACSISALSGVLIEQMLIAETIRHLMLRGIDPPIFISANIPGGREQGEKLRQRYEGASTNVGTTGAIVTFALQALTPL